MEFYFSLSHTDNSFILVLLTPNGEEGAGTAALNCELCGFAPIKGLASVFENLLPASEGHEGAGENDLHTAERKTA